MRVGIGQGVVCVDGGRGSAGMEELMCGCRYREEWVVNIQRGWRFGGMERRFGKGYRG